MDQIQNGREGLGCLGHNDDLGMQGRVAQVTQPAILTMFNPNLCTIFDSGIRLAIPLRLERVLN